MITEQYLHFTAHLDWMTADDILAYLDNLGLWPSRTPTAVKVREITAVLLAEDASGMPLVANRRQPDGQRVFKNDGSCTWKHLEALQAFYDAQVAEGKTRATEARDVTVQQGMAHRALPWEGVPDA